MSTSVDGSDVVAGHQENLRGPGFRGPEPMPVIAAELERLAADIDYWYRRDGAAAGLALHDALQAVHRTIVAVRDAQVADETLSIPEHWLG